MTKYLAVPFGVLLLVLPFYTSAATCPNLYRNLSVGSRGQDVVELQNFLIAEGHLTEGNNTGYFGLLTQAAVQSFQRKEGVVSSGSAATTGYGSVGPKTRAKIAQVCGGISYSQAGYYSQGSYYSQSSYTGGAGLQVSPMSGAAPLSVTFTATAEWPPKNGIPMDTACIYVIGDIDFGDPSSLVRLTGNKCSEGAPSAAIAHTYASPGTYTARLLKAGECYQQETYPPKTVCPPASLISTVTISVTGGTAGSLNAAPSAGTVPLTVQFSGTVPSAGYSIDYGDGTTSGDVGCGHGGCPIVAQQTSVSQSHTYSSPGTYTAKLRQHFAMNAGNCAGADCNVVGTATVVVSGY